MVSGREKGKIPKSEWPKILARHRGGETIAQIGRDYGCTAPAIRYIVKRSGELRAGPEKDVPARAAMPGPGTTLTGGLQPPLLGESTDHVLGAELRRRVSGAIASFLVALDQAVIEGSAPAITDLQDATDSLMRSIARVRLELERILDAERRPSRRGRDHASKPSTIGPLRGG